MVKSMFAAISGLKSHQSKMDVIGNNIANVNTWGYKTRSANFADAMYQNTINGSGGNITQGGLGGMNTSQLGFGVNVSSISTSFETGSWNPTGDGWNCMINGPSFFIVGPMTSGGINDNNITTSGLSLSRVGLFGLDNNGYVVDDQGNYVYGFALEDGTGIPEKAAQKLTVSANFDVTVANNGNGTYTVTIANIGITTSSNTLEGQIQDWIAQAPKQPNFAAYEGDYNISLNNYAETGGGNGTVNLTFTAKNGGVVGGATGPDQNISTFIAANGGSNIETLSDGADRQPGTTAVYQEELSPLRLPTDPDTGQRVKLESYTISTDGTLVGVAEDGRVWTVGKIAVASVENPNGLVQGQGYLYDFGNNVGDVTINQAGSDAVGKILSGYLEMSNVDLATEMANMITTQRGYQANSKIITVTDEMLEQLVNMKR